MSATPTTPIDTVTRPRLYGRSVLASACVRMFGGAVPALVAITANAAVQAGLTYLNPGIGTSPAFLAALAVSLLSVLGAGALLAATVLGSATGKVGLGQALGATRRHLGLCTAWALAMLLAVLVGEMLQTGLGLLVALALAYLPLAAMDGRRNALATNFAALADRPGRWAGTAIIVTIGGALWWLLSAVNVFFVKGTLASALAWLVGGVLVWWLGVAWACLYRSTRVGAAPQV